MGERFSWSHIDTVLNHHISKLKEEQDLAKEKDKVDLLAVEEEKWRQEMEEWYMKRKYKRGSVLSDIFAKAAQIKKQAVDK